MKTKIISVIFFIMLLLSCSKEPTFRCITIYDPLIFKPKVFYSDKVYPAIDTVYLDGNKVVAYTFCNINDTN